MFTNPKASLDHIIDRDDGSQSQQSRSDINDIAHAYITEASIQYALYESMQFRVPSHLSAFSNWVPDGQAPPGPSSGAAGGSAHNANTPLHQPAAAISHVPQNASYSPAGQVVNQPGHASSVSSGQSRQFTRTTQLVPQVRASSSSTLQPSARHNGPGPSSEEITRRTDQYLRFLPVDPRHGTEPPDRGKTLITGLATAYIQFVADLNLPVTNNAFDIRGDSQAYLALLHLGFLVSKDNAAHSTIVNRFIHATAGNAVGASSNRLEALSTEDKEGIATYRTKLNDAMLASDQAQGSPLQDLTKNRRGVLDNDITAINRLVEAFLHIRPLVASSAVGSSVASWNRKPEAAAAFNTYRPVFSHYHPGTNAAVKRFIGYLATGVATPPIKKPPIHHYQPS